jgi:hypothetical protein
MNSLGKSLIHPESGLKLIGRFRQQIREENTADSGPGLDIVDKQDLRVELTYKISNDFSIRNRAVIVRYRKGALDPEFGFLSFQDIILRPYGFENSQVISAVHFLRPQGSIQGSILMRMMFCTHILFRLIRGKGLRFYINCRYTISRGADLWLRYALIQLHQSGNDMEPEGTLISGNKRSDIRLQLRFQF